MDNIPTAVTPTSISADVITSGTLSSDRLPTIPITKGGTNATTASTALSNLGGLPTAGGTITGALTVDGAVHLNNADIRLGANNGSSDCKIKIGDGEYIYLHEKYDDNLEIYAGGSINLASKNIKINDNALPKNISIGTYTCTDTYPQTINLGFRPNFMIFYSNLSGGTIAYSEGAYGPRVDGFRINSNSLVNFSENDTGIVDTGFIIASKDGEFNKNTLKKLYYAAFKY